MAIRYGNYCIKNEDNVGIFLLGRGLEAGILDAGKFKVTEEIEKFHKNDVEIYVCGKCMEIKKSSETAQSQQW
ncbi:hypothetical protein [Methanonatronarchaeum sp. AMET-Sl]|uniref:hypothetical protein n=1 Tax=Methanonatronarchaeum sp. AMET-Sl TaxID=3037654 RepID=UPI00244DD696|nr:hypothetical protein [Methanonatronarchaeum sp. AMET-Sl]WGI17909.1 hypothetical protein QEN48_02565 [Methanonatronarchaeum sp. AMET-Sl]